MSRGSRSFSPPSSRFQGSVFNLFPHKSNSESHGHPNSFWTSKPGDEDDQMGRLKLSSRGHWRPAEDAKLRELVALYGPQNWNLIAEKLAGRSGTTCSFRFKNPSRVSRFSRLYRDDEGKSCRLRWFNQLDPRIEKRAFTEQEEERLMAAHRAYGNKWALIARLFPGRTDNAVKNHWHVVMARKYREQSTVHRKRRQSSSTLSSLEMHRNLADTEAHGDRMAMRAQSRIMTSDSTSTDLSSSSVTKGRHSSPAFIDFLGVGAREL